MVVRKSLLPALCVAGSLVLFAPPTQAAGPNLLTNGGFDTGNFTGWTLVNTSFTNVQLSGFDGITAESLPYFAALGNITIEGHIKQDFATTPGSLYKLDYFLASDGRSPNGFMTVTAGDTLFSATNIPAQPMTEYSFLFTATSATTTLDFGEYNFPGYLGLDSVSVTAASATVPEPGAVAFGVMAVGSALGLMARKRKA